MNAAESMKTVRSLFDQSNWRYEMGEDECVVVAGFHDQCGSFDITARIAESPACLFVLCRLPLSVPEPKRPMVSEALNRANFARLVGFFEMDPATGRIYCRASLPLDGAELSIEQVAYVLAGVVQRTSAYHRAFARLVFADDLSPAEVIAEVDLDERESDSSSAS